MRRSQHWRMHDLAVSLALAGHRMRRTPPRPKGSEPDATPVEPNRPLGLSGGAAAALEFDN